ncbi:MAG: DUF805 domain-containing protein [Fibromonadales bacterium]|nr:DUF805 domain-containing protein [Fibromonadales bacterium]
MAKIFYVNAPSSEGLFSAADAIFTDEYKKGVSLFRFVQKDDNTAEFGLSKKESATKLAMTTPAFFFACSAANAEKISNATSITVVKPGIVELQPNGDWKVVEKSIVRIENVPVATAPAAATTAAPVAAATTVSVETEGEPETKFEPENFTLWEYFTRCYTKKYATFSGRARRREYWGYVLFYFLIGIGISIVDSVLGLADDFGDFGILYTLFVLASIIPNFALSFRRLHDVGHSGWYLLWSFVPILGWILLFIAVLSDSVACENEYGPSPKQ